MDTGVVVRAELDIQSNGLNRVNKKTYENMELTQQPTAGDSNQNEQTNRM